ncbi:MAG: ABC transporter ATP-binding protein [Bacteroidales bacterium]|jgi:ABC-type multidrug transport system fused ATPase/permease subunit|nr:ABC transporter ATP-binding protein [Bacteroidales bacterium]
MSLKQLFIKIMPFVKPYKWLVVLTLVMTFIGSLAAQVNAVVLDKTVDEVNRLLHLEHFEWSQASYVMMVISAILLGKELLVLLINFVQKYYGERIKVLISQDLAAVVIKKVLTFKVAFFTRDENKPGKVQTRIDRGVDFITMTIKNFFIDILPLGTSAVLALVLMFAANFYVGLTALVIVPIYFYVTYLQAGKLKNWRTNMRNYREAKSNGIMNILQSINVIKSFNREEIEYTKQTDVINKLTDNQLNTRKYSFIYDGIKTFVEQIGTVFIIILTAYLVLTDYPGMTIGKIMYHIMLFSNVTAPIRQLHRIYDDVNEALIYAEGYFDILDAKDSAEQSGTYKPAEVRGDIEISHVNFTYPNGCKALTDISMSIPHGKITAFVGLSGAGKSTVVNLLDKFYEPDSGTITIDGVDIREWDTQYLRDNIGLVLQKNHIFDGTVEENIRYGRPDATFEEVCDAAKKAYIYDMIATMPDGFKTNASELSGGQQQRIAIARMFLKNPPIIFLDEPTASLDAIATEQIKNAIDAIKQNRTVVIISHSISQIIDSEMIYALNIGRVEQGGRPDEVYKQGGIYKDIIDASARSLNIDKIVKMTEG